ncbi:MAG: DUF308 domain-containing protein [Clostridia bacterium]|nr:DUF308 domain-containing protein [Clostridia bacterium]
MASFFHKFHIGSVSLFPGFCVVIGAVFLLFPDWVLGTLSLILGGLCIVYGAWKLITAIRASGFSRGGAVFGGIVAVLLGIYIIRHTERVFLLLPLAAGIFFLLDGIDRIRSAAEIHSAEKRGFSSSAAYHTTASMRRQKRRFFVTCILGVVTVLIGIFLLLYPFGAVRITLRIIGGFILADGIGALWTNHAVKTTFRIFDNASAPPPADGKYNADFRDISDN